MHAVAARGGTGGCASTTEAWPLCGLSSACAIGGRLLELSLEAQGVAHGHADLLLDQVHARDHLRHGVLHLGAAKGVCVCVVCVGVGEGGGWRPSRFPTTAFERQLQRRVAGGVRRGRLPL